MNNANENIDHGIKFIIYFSKKYQEFIRAYGHDCARSSGIGKYFIQRIKDDLKLIENYQ